ncbi:MAG: amino acid permease [Epsilonproteobacteria bacterium]|nr:amino acid permease [Campylobacterota bacterium]
METETELKRVISLPFLIFYGVGTIVGGGFYALLGEVVGAAGLFTPVALFLATLIALFSALSYAELSSRYPVSAGEAHYVKEAFSSENLAQIVGWLVIFTGVVSTATLTVAMARFLVELLPISNLVYIVGLVLFMGAIAIWGIKESVWFSTIITIIEVGGLLFIIYIASDSFTMLQNNYQELIPPMNLEVWQGIFVGIFLIFYAFIGFEDMVNIAQEVKDVKRTLPIAIMVSIAVTFVIYLLVAVVAIYSMDMKTFADAHAPLAQIAKQHSHLGYLAIWSIGILAGLNGALVQIIMASRVLYGISKKNRLKIFSEVNKTTQTPIYATLFVMVIVLLLALGFDLVILAKSTSTIILVLFALINIALITIKKREGRHSGFNVPLWLPYVGFISSSIVLIIHVGSLL